MRSLDAFRGLPVLLVVCAFASGGSGCATQQTVSVPPVVGVDLCPPTDSILDANGSEYGLSLIRQISQHSFYPENAQALGQSGTVQLCVEVARDGMIHTALVNDTSGYPLLDGAALYAVGLARMAADLKDVPDGLSSGARNLWFSVPVKFTIKDQNGTNADSTAIRHMLRCGRGAPAVPAVVAPPSPELNKYYLKIQKKIQEQVIYPQDAVALHEEGDVVVCFQVNRDGSVPLARVLKSSGQPLFDGIGLMAAAMAGLRGTIGPFPDAVPGSQDSMVLSFPVNWSFRP